MSKDTSIQWCDSTVNPVMGCDGCALYPASAQLIRAIGGKLDERGAPPEASRELLKRVFGERPFSALYHDRNRIGRFMGAALRVYDDPSPDDAAKLVEREIGSSMRCYAGVLHSRYGGNALKPNKQPKPGYARIFEEVKEFPGRMAEAARWTDLIHTDRPNAPWLNGLPRLIFVSDMGDALSRGIGFEYLKREIVDTALSEDGSRHVWLWLTKRPRRMAMFAKWLSEEGVDWPANLVPMTSVMNRKMAAHVKHLKRIPAKVRGLSVEPLVEEVELDLDGIDWVIAGGESGPYAMPFHLEWARELRDRCQKEGKSFFMKQLGAAPFDGEDPLKLEDKHGGDWDEWPADLRVRELPAAFPSLVVPKVPSSLVVKEAASSDPELDDFQRLNGIVLKGLEAFIEAGIALAEIRGRDLWKSAGYASWSAYCTGVAGLSKVHANRLIRAAGVGKMLGQMEPNGSAPRPTPRSESQIRPLFRLADPGQQVQAWEAAVERAGGQPTASQVAGAVAEMTTLEGSSEDRPVAGKRERRRQLVKNLRILAKERGSWDDVARIADDLEELL